MARVLIVDDAEMDLRVASRLADSLGCEPALASSAGEGLEILRDSTIELVISDIRMPSMDGITFAKRIREDHPQMRLVAMSAYLRGEEMVRLREAGYTYFMPKPLNKENFNLVVSAMLGLARPQ